MISLLHGRKRAGGGTRTLRAFRSRGDVSGTHDLNAGVAGEPCFVEGENGSEAMHLHCRHQSGIMRWFPGYLVLNDQALPHRVDRRGIGQTEETCFSGALVRRSPP